MKNKINEKKNNIGENVTKIGEHSEGKMEGNEKKNMFDSEIELLLLDRAKEKGIFNSGTSGNGNMYTSMDIYMQRNIYNNESNEKDLGIKRIDTNRLSSHLNKSESGYDFIELERKGPLKLNRVKNFLGRRISNLYSKVKSKAFSMTLIHGLDFILRNSLRFYKSKLILKYITYYAKMYVIQSLDMIFLIVRDYELGASLTNTNSIKHGLFNICLFNLQNISVSLKNILNIIDAEQIENILSYLISIIHMNYTGNPRFIEDLIKNINYALSKNATLKKLFGNFVSYLTISSIQTFELYFHSRYKKKLLTFIISILNNLSGTISSVFSEPFFQSYICTHLIKLGESFISEFNPENTVYGFFMDVAEINFFDIFISYIFYYFPQVVKDFIEI